MTRYVREFKGFAGVRLQADAIGSADDPSIILVHGFGQTRKIWEDVALGLEQAGRHVINIDLRGHGDSEWPEYARYDFDAYVEDLRAVLGQMRTRPVIAAAAHSGWIATAALAEDAATLASGLILVDPPAHADAHSVKVSAEAHLAALGQKTAKPKYDHKLFDALGTDGVDTRLATGSALVNIPVLVVRGAIGGMAVDEAPHFTAAFPNVETIDVDGGGLLGVAGRTEALNGLLIDFLERKQPRFVPEYRSG